MLRYADWCECKKQVIDGHELNVLLSTDSSFDVACDLVAASLQGHYISDGRLADIFERLGKDKAAAYLREKLPSQVRIRSGDLGEILAAEYINSSTRYITPIYRLRWKDHREMAMRGDDILGVAVGEGNSPPSFLKSESKSRASLSPSVVQEARRALNNCDGLPSPHALAFIADRLFETGEAQLADIIISALLESGISDKQVEHMLFTFCGNDPEPYLQNDLREYRGPIRQNAVGLRVGRHQEFISAVYDRHQAK